MRRTLDRSGAVAGEYACPQTSTSWDRVFRMLRQQFPDAHYHIGKLNDKLDLPVQGWAAGIYHVQIFNESAIQLTRKIIVE